MYYFFYKCYTMTKNFCLRCLKLVINNSWKCWTCARSFTTIFHSQWSWAQTGESTPASRTPNIFETFFSIHASKAHVLSTSCFLFWLLTPVALLWLFSSVSLVTAQCPASVFKWHYTKKNDVCNGQIIHIPICQECWNFLIKIKKQHRVFEVLSLSQLNL